MTDSQNGWRANDKSLIVPLTVHGVSFPGGVRKGNVHALFRWLASEYHTKVEELHAGWCWGYSPRYIRDSNSIVSNHASGTALDFNAPDHPRGTNPRSNYSAKQVRAIRRILEKCHVDGVDVIRWGGDYVNAPKDGMHFEINADATHVAKLVDKLLTIEDDDMQPSDKMSVPDWMQKEWHDDKGIADGKISVRTTLVSGYGHARASHNNTDELLKAVKQLTAEVEALKEMMAGNA